MRTGVQQRYYDILRREDRRKPQALCAAASSNGSTLISGSYIATSSHKGSTIAAGADVTRAARATSASAGLWDPIAQLCLDSTTVVSMRELACDHRGLTALHPHFTRFEQLNSLVLNHNALRTVHNLLPPSHLSRSASPNSPSPLNKVITTAETAPLYSGCRRLTHLYLSHNELCDVARDTDIPRLQLLEHLSLAHNHLKDVDETLAALRRLRHLRYLDLRHNPLVDAPSYRQRCIAALPQVEVLDGLTVTVEERRRNTASANSFMKSHMPNNATTITATTTTLAASSDDDSDVDPLRLSDRRKTCKKRAARSRFAKSAVARDLDVKYAAYLQQQQQDKAAAIEARAAAERQKEETWEAFHTVWILSQPGMPLTEERWRATMAVVGTRTQPGSPALSGVNSSGGNAAGENGIAASVNSHNSANNSNPISNNAGSGTRRKSPSTHQQHQQSLSSGLPGRPRTPVPTRGSQPPQNSNNNNPLEETGSAAGATAVVKSVEVPRDQLLPPIFQQQQQQPSEKDKAVHDSPYFRIVRGTGKANANDFAKMLTSATLNPSPVRLAALQEALQASTSILRAANSNVGYNEADATYRPFLAFPATGAGAVNSSHSLLATEPRKSGGGSLLPLTTAPLLQSSKGGVTATCPVDINALRLIQQNKYAVIPPPWEREDDGHTDNCQSGAKGSIPRSLGVVQPNTIIQEALVEVLVLLHQLFSAEELQLLETEYGRTDLLRLLPLPEWSVNWDATATDTTLPVDTLRAARQEMLLLLRPGTAIAGGGSSSGCGGVGSSATGGTSSSNNNRRLASEERKKGAGGAAAGRSGSGPQRNTSVTPSSSNSYSTTSGGGGNGGNGILSANELAAAALTAARTSLLTEPAHVWNLFVHPYFASAPVTVAAAPVAAAITSSRASPASQGKGGEAGGMAISSSGNNSNATGGTGNNNSSSASAAAAAAEVTLHDPEAVQQLVCPFGPYEEHVLSSFLKLLKPPPSLDLEALCEGLWRFHAAGQRTTTAAAARAATTINATTTTSTTETGRSGPVVSKIKKEAAALAGTEADTNERKKRAVKSGAGGAMMSANNVVWASITTAPPSHSHELSGLRSSNQPALTPQLTVLSLLTALLFHPVFVRARLQHWEQELVRMTMAAAAAAPTTTNANTTTSTTATNQNAKSESRVGSGGASGSKSGLSSSGAATTPAKAAVTSPAITPLSRLFHRVQELKAHVTRVEKAAAWLAEGRASEKRQPGRPKHDCFVDPTQALMTYQ